MKSKIHRVPARERVAPVPLGDFDVFEDEGALINRLYYGVPSFEEGAFRCPVFFEENTFRKEANGDLTLIRSVRKAER